MLSMLKMELRRLFRCKSFYFAILIFLGFTGYCIFSQAKWQIINGYSAPQHLQLEAGLHSIIDYYLTMPLQFMYVFALKNGLIIFGIFIVSYISTDYQSGFIKNTAMMCKNRNIIIINKLVVFIMISIIILLLSFVLSIVLGYIFVENFAFGNILDILVYSGITILMNVTFFSSISFLYRLLNNKMPSILICIFMPLGLTMTFLQPIIKNFIDYTISGAFLSLPIYFTVDVSWRIIVVCFVYIAIYQGFSILLFRKRDI